MFAGFTRSQPPKKKNNLLSPLKNPKILIKPIQSFLKNSCHCTMNILKLQVLAASPKIFNLQKPLSFPHHLTRIKEQVRVIYLLWRIPSPQIHLLMILTLYFFISKVFVIYRKRCKTLERKLEMVNFLKSQQYILKNQAHFFPTGKW